MKLHPRFFLVQKAENEVRAAVHDLQRKHDLTEGEMVQILCGLISNAAKYIIRTERHGDEGKKGDEG